MKTHFRRLSSQVLGFARRLHRDERGVTAIEFAIAAPLLLFMILGTIELAFDMMMDAGVQIAAQTASRYGMTTTATASQAQALAIQVLQPWANIKNTTISVTTASYASYGAISTGTSTSGTGTYTSVVAYTVTLTTAGPTGILQIFGIPTLTFQRNYLVQNEQ